MLTETAARIASAAPSVPIPPLLACGHAPFLSVEPPPAVAAAARESGAVVPAAAAGTDVWVSLHTDGHNPITNMNSNVQALCYDNAASPPNALSPLPESLAINIGGSGNNTSQQQQLKSRRITLLDPFLRSDPVAAAPVPGFVCPDAVRGVDWRQRRRVAAAAFAATTAATRARVLPMFDRTRAAAALTAAAAAAEASSQAAAAAAGPLARIGSIVRSWLAPDLSHSLDHRQSRTQSNNNNNNNSSGGQGGSGSRAAAATQVAGQTLALPQGSSPPALSQLSSAGPASVSRFITDDAAAAERAPTLPIFAMLALVAMPPVYAASAAAAAAAARDWALPPASGRGSASLIPAGGNTGGGCCHGAVGDGWGAHGHFAACGSGRGGGGDDSSLSESDSSDDSDDDDDDGESDRLDAAADGDDSDGTVISRRTTSTTMTTTTSTYTESDTEFSRLHAGSHHSLAYSGPLSPRSPLSPQERSAAGYMQASRLSAAAADARRGLIVSPPPQPLQPQPQRDPDSDLSAAALSPRPDRPERHYRPGDARPAGAAARPCRCARRAARSAVRAVAASRAGPVPVECAHCGLGAYRAAAPAAAANTLAGPAPLTGAGAAGSGAAAGAAAAASAATAPTPDEVLARVATVMDAYATFESLLTPALTHPAATSSLSSAAAAAATASAAAAAALLSPATAIFTVAAAASLHHQQQQQQQQMASASQSPLSPSPLSSLAASSAHAQGSPIAPAIPGPQAALSKGCAWKPQGSLVSLARALAAAAAATGGGAGGASARGAGAGVGVSLQPLLTRFVRYLIIVSNNGPFKATDQATQRWRAVWLPQSASNAAAAVTAVSPESDGSSSTALVVAGLNALDSKPAITLPVTVTRDDALAIYSLSSNFFSELRFYALHRDFTSRRAGAADLTAAAVALYSEFVAPAARTALWGLPPRVVARLRAQIRAALAAQATAAGQANPLYRPPPALVTRFQQLQQRQWQYANNNSNNNNNSSHRGGGSERKSADGDRDCGGGSYGCDDDAYDDDDANAECLCSLQPYAHAPHVHTSMFIPVADIVFMRLQRQFVAWLGAAVNPTATYAAAAAAAAATAAGASSAAPSEASSSGNNGKPSGAVGGVLTLTPAPGSSGRVFATPTAATRTTGIATATAVTATATTAVTVTVMAAAASTASDRSAVTSPTADSNPESESGVTAAVASPVALTPLLRAGAAQLASAVSTPFATPPATPSPGAHGGGGGSTVSGHHRSGGGGGGGSGDHAAASASDFMTVSDSASSTDGNAGATMAATQAPKMPTFWGNFGGAVGSVGSGGFGVHSCGGQDDDEYDSVDQDFFGPAIGDARARAAVALFGYCANTATAGAVLSALFAAQQQQQQQQQQQPVTVTPSRAAGGIGGLTLNTAPPAGTPAQTWSPVSPLSDAIPSYSGTSGANGAQPQQQQQQQQPLASDQDDDDAFPSTARGGLNASSLSANAGASASAAAAAADHAFNSEPVRGGLRPLPHEPLGPLARVRLTARQVDVPHLTQVFVMTRGMPLVTLGREKCT